MKRFYLNLSMLLLLLFVMSFHFLPRTAHEVLGLILLGAVLWHLKLNLKWFASLGRGRWTSLRVLQSLTGILLVAAFLTAVTTGIIISNHVFRALWQGVPLHRSIFVHQLHIFSSYLMFILGGLHLGQHWSALWVRLAKLPLLGWLATSPRLRVCLVTVICLAGCAFSRLDRIGDRLLFKHTFGTLATKLPGSVFFLLLICLAGLYASGFYYLQRYLQKQSLLKQNETDSQ